MSHPGKMIIVQINPAQTYQMIDGFGVNINSRYFDERLMPAMHLLRDDLGATLYRVDIWGKSNWIDPTGQLGRTAMDPAHQTSIYGGEIFGRGWSMMRWLNQHGIQPYLTASGIVPGWMLAPDGKTLTDFDAFTDMMVEMLAWAKQKEHLDFTLFGPLNETDLGAPEGPTLGPQGYAKVCEMLIDKLDARGLNDIKLVLAEQSGFNARYLQEFINSPKLQGRIAAFGMHCYADLPPALFQEITGVVNNSPYAGTPIWMTEYGDLEQSGEREWWVAWVMTARLFDLLEAGFRGALVWDAYDNYHDHDEHWTIYGLLRTGLRVHTPKKRFYASKHVFRFVPPGFVRIAAHSDSSDVRVLAFSNPARDQLTVVGINQDDHPVHLNVQLNGLDRSLQQSFVTCYRTTETDNCVAADRIPVKGANWPFTAIDAAIPPASIFTLTTL